MAQIIHSRHRSYQNYVNNLVVGIVAFCFFLTSSTRTPKFVSKEFCYALVSFHWHSFSESLTALRQSEDDGCDCLGHVEHLVNTHADVGGL